MKCLIVDDEELSRISLRNLISRYCSFLNIIGEASNMKDGVELINKLKPEILFLDIQMPNGNGFKLLDQLETRNIKVIFVSAHEEYALKAIKYSALEYLLKPVNPIDLIRVVEKIKQINTSLIPVQIEILNQYNNNFKKSDRLVLSTLEEYIILNIKDIIYCKADGNYTHFFVKDMSKVHIVSQKLGEYEKLMDPNIFFRIHKSYIVNIFHILRILKKEGGDVCMSDGTIIPISNRKKEAFYKIIKSIK
jgi:two-component system, LytTR family, response regulator